MRLLDRFFAGRRRGGRADSGTLVINCDPDPRSTSISARLCRAYLDGARSADRPVQYFSCGEAGAADQEVGGAWQDRLRKGAAVKHMMLVCSIAGDLPSLFDLFAKPWMQAMTASLRPSTIRIVFITPMPAFLQRTALQHSPSVQKFRGLFPAARIRQDFIGGIDNAGPEQYLWWIATMREYGSEGV